MKGYIARLPLHRLLLLLAMAMLTAFAAPPVAEAQAEPCFAMYEFAGGEACSDRWMADMAEVIGQRPLNQVVIPGAHDAATFQMNNVFWHQFGCPFIGVECLGSPDQFINQNSDFPEQLRVGMRWFDIRAQWTPIPPPARESRGV